MFYLHYRLEVPVYQTASLLQVALLFSEPLFEATWLFSAVLPVDGIVKDLVVAKRADTKLGEFAPRVRDAAEHGGSIIKSIETQVASIHKRPL